VSRALSPLQGGRLSLISGTEFNLNIFITLGGKHVNKHTNEYLIVHFMRNRQGIRNDSAMLQEYLAR
jgi:hypothetical protein